MSWKNLKMFMRENIFQIIFFHTICVNNCKKDFKGDINSMKEIKTYDKNGNLIYHKYPTGLDIVYAYNENNQCVHVKASNGVECDRQYDEQGRLLSVKYNDGFEFWYSDVDDKRQVYIKNRNNPNPPICLTA